MRDLTSLLRKKGLIMDAELVDGKYKITISSNSEGWASYSSEDTFEKAWKVAYARVKYSYPAMPPKLNR